MAKELAQYVKRNAILQKPVIELAHHILGEIQTPRLASNIRSRIAQSKLFLAEFPNNALGWIERARCYTIDGQVEKANKCVSIALNLAPSDRYIVRCAVRFYIHSDNIDQAWHCVKRASEVQFDPWIKATEISIAELLNKSVKKLKGVIPTSGTPDHIFHYSELIESFGMLELINGNDHRAKKSFMLAWSNPSHNVVTHSEWIVRARFPALANIAEGKFVESIEATAWQKYHQMKIDEALVAALEWALEEPYARNAYSLASGIAFHNNNYDSAINIVKEGLKSSPYDFGLQNNLCFGLLKKNLVDQAELELLKITPPVGAASHVVYTATKGLLEYKKGNITKGRNLYFDAISGADKLGDRRLCANAFINFAIAELDSNTVEAQEYANAALKLSERLDDVSVALTRQLLNARLAESKQKMATLPFKEFHRPKILPP
jgi:tetratricopeptide (TPR) repeat protein